MADPQWYSCHLAKKHEIERVCFSHRLCPNHDCCLRGASYCSKQYEWVAIRCHYLWPLGFSRVTYLCDRRQRHGFPLSSFRRPKHPHSVGRGFPATFEFVIAALLAILVIQFLHTRELKQTAEINHEDTEAISSEEVLHIDGGPTKGFESGESRGAATGGAVVS
ncbi:hypothetical protein EAF00_003079 [Botryotinia globosa]|nr:hypothetical protein EAF00_003079 [Botryotinia globosa]